MNEEEEDVESQFSSDDDDDREGVAPGSSRKRTGTETWKPHPGKSPDAEAEDYQNWRHALSQHVFSLCAKIQKGKQALACMPHLS